MRRYGPRFIGTLVVRQSRDVVVAAVKKAINEAGIEFPFPYRTLAFGGNVPGECPRGIPRPLCHERPGLSEPPCWR